MGRTASLGTALRAVSSAMFAAVAVTTAVAVGTATAAPEPVTRPIELAALVSVGSSTNPAGTGVENFFQDRFNPAGTEIRRVNFFTGPWGIHSALTSTPESDVLLSSGWGAANASAILSWYALTDPGASVLTDNRWVLDNNVARPNGGWGTRYPVFALIGVNPVPTPQIDGVPVIDIGYQYDANSNAPAYFLNPIADLNSLVAYTQRRLNQSELYLPVHDDGSIVGSDGVGFDRSQCASVCTVRVGDHPSGAPQYAEIKVVGDTTYVTYLSDGLPLVQPLRSLGPAGASLADALAPVATVLVNAGYPDNRPTADPDRYVPGSVLPPPRVVTTALRELPAAIQQGAESLRRDGERATDAVTEPEALRPRVEPALKTDDRLRLDIETTVSSSAAEPDDDADTTRRPRHRTPKVAAGVVDRLVKRSDARAADTERAPAAPGADAE